MIKLFWVAIAFVIGLALFFLIGAATARADSPIAELKNLKAGELAMTGFELTQREDIEINAVGARSSHDSRFFTYGWIIDADTREQVWSMQDDCGDMNHLSDYLYECEETTELRPGRYEVYYYVGRPFQILSEDDISINDLGELITLLGEALSSEKGKGFKLDSEDIEELGITLRAEISGKSYTPRMERPANVVVDFRRPGPNEYHRYGFKLSRETSLLIRAIGEYSDSYEQFVDGGWIINADTREKVWSMDKWNTDRAGGANKNRLFNGEVTLPAGDYIACYATDDSHDSKEWNAQPPVDPLNYGLLITTTKPEGISNIKPYNEAQNRIEIISMTRMHDDAFEKHGFRLKQKSAIHIIALGERSFGDNELTDMGWIVNADNMERVWEMTADNTVFAGGAAKNCLFDGIIELPAGNYIVYYRTDDSHAYNEWNDAPPFNPEEWGISLFGAEKGFSRSDFELTDKFQSGQGMIVNLTGLGDDVDTSQVFSLDKPTTLRIVALGEGRSGAMYDYGWIKNNETGKTVWKMRYGDTQPAGGAQKNRIETETITLPKGKYTATFITDDSHSLAGFNAAAPDNPEWWGMSIVKK